MCVQMSYIDFTDTEVLRDQLIGVDKLYMERLIDNLESNPDDFKDVDYLMEVIEELFDD